MRSSASSDCSSFRLPPSPIRRRREKGEKAERKGAEKTEKKAAKTKKKRAKKSAKKQAKKTKKTRVEKTEEKRTACRPCPRRRNNASFDNRKRCLVGTVFYCGDLCALNLARTKATGADIDRLVRAVDNRFDTADVGLPCSVRLTVGVRNVMSERDALTANAAICHFDTMINFHVDYFLRNLPHKYYAAEPILQNHLVYST